MKVNWSRADFITSRFWNFSLLSPVKLGTYG